MPPKKLTLGPALTTCASNKNTHPGNIVKPRPCCTPAEVEQLRQQEAEKEKEQEDSRRAAAEELASMEDRLQVEAEQHERKRIEIYKGKNDTTREANKHSPKVAQSSGQVPTVPGSYEIREDSSDHKSCDENEEDDEDINVSNKRKRKTKNKRLRREDVDTLRKTQPTGGKSLVNNNSQKRNVSQHPGKGANKMHGICLEWNNSHDGEGGESMVKFGGIIDDNELDDVECDAIKARSDLMPGKTGIKKERKKMIKIEEIDVIQPKTLKESRGGADKWTEHHLPSDAKADFKDMVVPLAKKRAGNLEPWATLSTKDVQEIVDEVYGAGKFHVHDDDVFVGLTNSRLHGWRNGFAQAALNTIDLFITKNELNTKELIAEQIGLHLEKIVVCAETDQCMYAYQWAEWDSEQNIRMGFLKNNMILRMFGIAHLASIGTGLDNFEEEKPIGALLLAMQAVGRAFELWQDAGGVDPIKEAKEANRKIKPFLTDNFGDKKTEIRKNGLVQQDINRVATFFVPTIKQKFDEKYWEEILDGARVYASEVNTKRQRASPSGSSIVSSSRIKESVTSESGLVKNCFEPHFPKQAAAWAAQRAVKQLLEQIDIGLKAAACSGRSDCLDHLSSFTKLPKWPEPICTFC
ncbi:hypothetical protein JOM56_007100 [Amanita muscaria]